MSTQTTNLKLVKPADNETADIQVINANMDILDTEVNKRALKTDIPSVPVVSVNDKTGAVKLTAADVGAVSTDTFATQMADKANETDNSRTTTNKTVTGAINELNTNKVTNTDLDPKTTGGTATAYTVTLNNPNLNQLIIVPHVDCGVAPTLSINGANSLTIVKQDGSAIAVGDIKANKPLSLVRVGSNFFIRSSGSKKWAIGTFTPTSISANITVTGLAFKPRVIWWEDKQYDSAWCAGRWSSDSTVSNNAMKGTNNSFYNYASYASVTFNNNGFTINTGNYDLWAASQAVQYIAIE